MRISGLIALIVTGVLAWYPAPVTAQEDAQPVEATSLLGEPLRRPVLPDEFRKKQEALLKEAQDAFTANPDDPDAVIWVGRRLGYLGRYGEVIETFESGATKFPHDARFPRHIGHRLITTRKLDRAIEAFKHAAALTTGKPDEIEPDGLPNAAGIPTSTLKGNIWYHLGLAYYLKGDFAKAESAYHVAWGLAANPDALVASAYWLYLCRARNGDLAGAKEVLAPVTANLEIIENHAYHRLALAFKGKGDLDAILAEAREASGGDLATSGYGVAAQRLIMGNRDSAHTLMREIVETSPSWPSFGYIAAEADLFRGTFGDAE